MSNLSEKVVGKMLAEDAKVEWIKALRSNNYLQGKYHLKQWNKDSSCSYCCLGVLCDVYEKNYIADGEKGWKTTGCEIFEFGGNHNSPPDYVKDFIHLDPATLEHLIHMNDKDNKNFLEISDWLEHNFLIK